MGLRLGPGPVPRSKSKRHRDQLLGPEMQYTDPLRESNWTHQICLLCVGCEEGRTPRVIEADNKDGLDIDILYFCAILSQQRKRKYISHLNDKKTREVYRILQKRNSLRSSQIS